MADSFTKLDFLAGDLRFPWLITGAVIFSLIVYLFVAHRMGTALQYNFALPEAQRLVLRSVLYAIAITTLPLTNLIRHICVRLNQTMPGPVPAGKRYLVTVLVSMVMVESISLFGLLMFILGDDFNTLYIFLGMSALGLFLYRPKQVEYLSIAESLTSKNEG